MFATITLAGTVTAQGPVLDTHADGRVTIADGLRRLTGWPVARAVRGTLSALALTMLSLGAAPAPLQAETLLNVSYDPTRELYREVNEAFTAWWVAQGNEAPTIEVSHGGSGSQARAVIDGLEAHVLTLALAGDIDRVAAAGIETMLSLVEAMPGLPVWAALSSSHLGAVLLPEGVQRLYIAIDRDPAGQRAAERLSARALDAGIAVRVLEPRLGDFNDDLRANGKDALRQHLARQIGPEDRHRLSG